MKAMSAQVVTRNVSTHYNNALNVILYIVQPTYHQITVVILVASKRYGPGRVQTASHPSHFPAHTEKHADSLITGL